MNKEFLVLENHQNHIVLFAQGDWVLQNAREIELQFQNVLSHKKIIFNFSRVTHFDSAGVLLFIEYMHQLKKIVAIEIVEYSEKQKEMYDLLCYTDKKIVLPKKKHFLIELGKNTLNAYDSFIAYITFLGHLFFALFYTWIYPKNIRIKETVYHIHQSGFNALLIIGLTSFLVGMVISYQGSVQLAKFGADMFIVDTVGISITRELGPMITAIVIAGRSGSAYTAEIGAMKITEEIAAMRTMGFDPYRFLVLPRVIALMVALPLLIFFSDIIGILGGMVASNLQLGISMTQFIDRLYEVLEVKHYILGMLKGPIFAFIIASIGCFRGFQVSNNTESIGLHTTASVVNAIFLVIAFDALFSVLYTELGL